MNELLLRKLSDLMDGDPAVADGRGAPGRQTLTSRLMPAPQIIFRMGRDGNGVAEDAEEAVGRAAGSGGGAPLRGDLRTRFEASLGADLSAVRVHTGGASAEANQAVGARAYTVGNDIHFGAGSYQPDDPFGVHLLAHEVAHTVQQAGGAARRQHKLEVSTPGDALEVEADRAADAMVAGRPASVTTSRYAVQRDAVANNGNYLDMRDAGEAGAAEARPHNQLNAGTETYLGASSKNDRAQAEAMLGMVAAGQHELNDASIEDTSTGTAAMLVDNIGARVALTQYIAAASKQDAMQSQFETELKKTNVQYARIEAMYQKACANLGVTSESTEFDAARATDLAMNGSNGYELDTKQAVKEQAVYTGAGSAPHKQRMNSDITRSMGNITRLESELLGLPGEMGVAVSELKGSHSKVNAAVALMALPPPVRQPDEDQQKQNEHIVAVKAELETAVSIINTAVTVATTGLGFIKMGGGTPGAATVAGPDTPTIAPGKSGLAKGGDVFGTVDMPNLGGAADDIAAIQSVLKHTQTGASVGAAIKGEKFGFVEGVADALTGYTLKVNRAKAMIGTIDDATTRASMQQAADAMLAEKEVLEAKLKELRRIRAQFDLTAGVLRAETDKLMLLIDGNRNKDGSGPDFGVVLAFQTESTVFLAQADSALEVGKVEREAAKDVPTVANSATHGQPYWRAMKKPRPAGMPNEEKGYWDYTRNVVYFVELGDDTQRVMDKNMDTAMQGLAADRTRVEGFRSKLREFTGI